MSVINKRTFSKTRRISYRDTSRTSCFDERQIKTHREHSIIEKRTSLTSITKRFLVTKRFFEEDQRCIFYNIFDYRSMSLSRAHDDMRKKIHLYAKFQKRLSDHLNRELNEKFSSSSRFK